MKNQRMPNFALLHLDDVGTCRAAKSHDVGNGVAAQTVGTVDAAGDFTGSVQTRNDLAVDVKKGNTELLKRINRGLATIKQNGEFAKIFEKWFGRQPEVELLND